MMTASTSLLQNLRPPRRSSLRRSGVPRRQLERRWRIGDILWAARLVLREEGIEAFNMELIATRVGLSRAALYQYFSCNEEVLVALAIQTGRVRVRLYERAAQLAGRPRERMVAIGEVTPILYPDLVMPEILADSDAVRARASADRRRQLQALERVGYETTIGVVEEAIAAGDVTLPGAMTPRELVFGLAMMVKGIYGSLDSSLPLAELGVLDLHRQQRRMGRLILDGVGWEPLSRGWNYGETLARIHEELMPRESVVEIASEVLAEPAASPSQARRH